MGKIGASLKWWGWKNTKATLTHRKRTSVGNKTYMRHGTRSMYNHAGCRCEECVEAARQHNQKMRKRWKQNRQSGMS